MVVCLELGWSWAELQATPDWVVRDVMVYLQKSAIVAKERERIARGKRR